MMLIGKEVFCVHFNPRTVTKTKDCCYCTAIGSISLTLNKVTSWSIKILKSKSNDGCFIYIGVVPFEINPNKGYNYGNVDGAFIVEA